MFALVDCNSFFCSVEKVFHPGLSGKPVCVLSSNDGIIVALTPECKRLGLRRGDPLFKVKGIVEKNNVHVFSGNMRLYAAMSKRVVSILRKSVHKVEVYSIDESFCDLTEYEQHYNLTEFMRGIAQKIRLWTDIPVSVGIAPTKTLAKMGSKYAKQYAGYNGVCAIDTNEKRRKALEKFMLADVWGIGRRTLRKLNYLCINTPLEFADKKESWIRSHFDKPVVQTWFELNGIPCIDTHEIEQNKSLCTSRSFGEMITEFESLKASVVTFAASCANKLRGQNAGCKVVTVFLQSNRFRDDIEQYSNAASHSFLIPTSDTIEITNGAIEALRAIYRQGIQYKKSGVIVSDISSMGAIQQHLFDTIPNRLQRIELMKAIDEINQQYGLKTISLGAEKGGAQAWKVKSEYRYDKSGKNALHIIY